MTTLDEFTSKQELVELTFVTSVRLPFTQPHSEALALPVGVLLERGERSSPLPMAGGSKGSEVIVSLELESSDWLGTSTGREMDSGGWGSSEVRTRVKLDSDGVAWSSIPKETAAPVRTL